MKRIPYAEMLERWRRAEPVLDPLGPFAGLALEPRHEAVKRLKIRLTPDERRFVREAAKASHERTLDESDVVAGAIELLEALDLPWSSIGSRDDLVSEIRRRLADAIRNKE